MVVWVKNIFNTPSLPAGGGDKDYAALQETLLANDPTLPKVRSVWLSDTTRSSIYFSGDIPSVWRSGVDVFSSLGMSGPFTPYQYNAFGSITGINLPLGIAEMRMDYDKMKHSKEIGDKRGEIINTSSLIKGGALAASGANFIALRGLAAATSAEGAKATTLLGRVTTGAVIFGLVAYVVYFFLFCIIFGVPTYEGVKLKHKLAKAESVAEKYEILRKKIEVDAKKIKTKVGEDALYDDGLKKAKANLAHLMQELDIQNVSDEKLEEVVSKLTDRKMLISEGLSHRVQSKQMKKEAKLSRILMSSGIEDIKKLKGFATIEEKTELVQKIESSVNKKFLENAISFSTLALGLVTMIAALIGTGGAGILVASVLMLAFSAIVVGIDGYFLIQAFIEEQTPKSPHDKKMIILSSVIAIASFAFAASLMAAGVVSAGVVPMIVAATLLTLWLATNGVTYAVLERNERRYKEKNPTLEDLHVWLEKNRDVEKMVENLPKELREMVGDQITKETVAAAIETVKKIKQEQLEELRMQITPFLLQEMSG